MSYLPVSQSKPDRPNFRTSLIFDTALDFSEAQYACSGKLLNKSHPTDRDIVGRYRAEKYEFSTCEVQWPMWIETLAVTVYRTHTNIRKQLNEALKVAQIASEFQYEGIVQGLHPDIVKESAFLMQNLLKRLLDAPEKVAVFWSVAKELFAMAKKSRVCFSKQYKEDPWKASEEHKVLLPKLLGEGSTQARFGHRLVFLELAQSVKVFPKDWLLMIAFKSLESFNVLLSIYLREGVDLQEGSYSLALQYLFGCAKILTLEGPVGFDKLKSLEGVHVGLIIQECDVFTEVPILDATVASLDTPTWRYSGSGIQIALTSSDYPLRTELLSLHKLVGHPSVSSVAGFRKVLKRGTASKEINPEHLTDVVSSAIKNVCSRYFEAHGRWPVVSLKKGIGRRLELAILKNWSLSDRRIPHGLSWPDLREWMCVDLSKNADFNYITSVIPLLKDKSTSPVSDFSTEYYQYCAGVSEKYATIEKGKREEASSRTRLLLSYVLKNDMGREILDFLDKFQLDPELVTDFLVIKLTAKEKELKREPRMFGLSTFENRSRLLLTSKNLDPFLRSYSPNVCFSLSKEDLIKKMLALKDLAHLSLEPSETFFAHIDSSGWCSAFRKEVCAPFGKLLDKWYGTRLYEPQEAYTLTKLCAFQYGSYLESDGMEGGVEGLDQPFWTWIYDTSITTSLDLLQYPSQGCVKGDDAKYGILVPKVEIEKSSYDMIAKRLALEVQTAIEKIGQSGKTEETFISTKLLTFNKKWCLDHIFLPNMSKGLAKVHGYGESSFPTVSDLIGTCYSNAHSSCSEGNLHFIPYLMATINAVWHLQDTEFALLSEEAKATLLMWPSCIGGMPVLLLSDFFVNSESDQLTGFLALSNTASRTNHPLNLHFQRLLRVPITPSISALPLCQDPYSLNITRPQDPSTILRKVLRSQLEKISVNQDLRSIFSALATEYEIQLDHALRGLDALPAKPLNALYSGSILGLQQDILAKFETSHSMLNFLARTRYGNYRLSRLHKKLQYADKTLIKWRITTLTCPTFQPSMLLSLHEDCSAQWAQKCRDWCWQKPVFGVTYPCMTEMSYCIPSTAGDCILDDGTEIKITTSFLLRRKPAGEYSTKYYSDHYRNGPFKPFLGKTTAEVLSLPALHLDSDSPCVAKILGLLKLHAFMDVEGSQFNKLVEHALSYLTSKSLEDLMPFRQTKQRGTTTHTLRARGFKESIHINRYPNAFTMVQGDSSYNTDSRLQDNVTMNFLELLVYESEMCLLPLEFSSKLPSTPADFLFAIRNCNTCLSSVDDTCIGLVFVPPKGRPAPSRLLAVDQATLSVIEEKLNYLETSYGIVQPVNFQLPEYSSEMILGRFWRERRIDLRHTSLVGSLKLKTHHAALARDLSGQILMTKPADRTCLVTVTTLFRLPVREITKSILKTFLGFSSRDETAETTDEAIDTGIAYISGGCSYMWDAGMGQNIVKDLKNLIIEEGEDDVQPLIIAQRIHSSVAVFLKHFRQSMVSWIGVKGPMRVSVTVLDGTESRRQKEESCRSALHAARHEILEECMPELLLVSNPGDEEAKFIYVCNNWKFNLRLRKGLILACASLSVDLHMSSTSDPHTDHGDVIVVTSALSSEVLSQRLPSSKLRSILEKQLGLTPSILRTVHHHFLEHDQDWTDELSHMERRIISLYRRDEPVSAKVAIPYVLDSLRQRPKLTDYHALSEEADPEESVLLIPYPTFALNDASFLITGGTNPAVPMNNLDENAPFLPVTWPVEEDMSDMDVWFFNNKHNITGKVLGTSTSGACEAHVIISQIGLGFTAAPTAPKLACLGDGNGGFSVYLAARFPRSRVYYSNPPRTGRTETTSTESRSMRFPALGLEAAGSCSNIDSNTLNWEITCDLTDQAFWSRIAMLGLGFNFISVTADASTSDISKIIRNACLTDRMVHEGGAILIGIRREVLMEDDLLHLILSRWEKVSVHKNTTSSYLGRDGWLLLQSPKERNFHL